MSIVILNGVPGSKKTEIVNRTIELGEANRIKVSGISAGDIYSQRIHQVAPHGTILGVSDHIQRFANAGIPDQMVLQVLLDSNGHDHHLLDMPMTVMGKDGIVRPTVRLCGFDSLRDRVDRVVTLYGTPDTVIRNVGERYRMTPNKETTLAWINSEMTRSRDLSNHHGLGDNIVVSEDPDTTLFKMIVDNDAPVVYMAFPISKIKHNQEQMGMIDDFVRSFEPYGALVKPIIIEDANFGETEARYTVDRDLRFFVSQANAVVAFFPSSVPSTGVKREMDRGYDLGLNTFLIHPEPDKTPFGSCSTLTFRSPEEFYEAIGKSRRKCEYLPLSQFLDPTSETPRPRYGMYNLRL